MRNRIDRHYKRAPVVSKLTRKQLADLLVDLQRRIQGDSYVIEKAEGKFVSDNRACQSGDLVVRRPSIPYNENRASQQTEQRWRIAFENSAIGITMADFAGRYFAANSVFRNMLGYPESELYQLTFVDVTHEPDREANLALVRELVEGKRQHFEIEKRYRRKDGSLVWVRNNVALVPGTGAVEPFWFGIVEDITQRKRIEEELRLQIEVLQNIPALVWTVTPDGRCDFINQFFLDATGMTREYIQSHPDEWNKTGSDFPPLFSGLPPQDRERAASLFWNGIRTGEGWAFETQHFHASDRTYHWYFDRAVPLRDSHGKVVRFVGTCTEIEPLKRVQQSLRESETRLYASHVAEITERRRLETARRHVEEEYRVVQGELARVSRLTTMGELAASIAHEVNQPLAAITNNSNGCLRLLADSNLEPKVLRQALEEIVTDATRASAVIARIRAFIRKAPAGKNRLDINEVIQEVLALIGHELRENRVLVERQLKSALPLVLGDRVQLQQVMLNLIMNGIEAMTLVSDRPRLLWVQTRVDEPEKVLVGIADSGPGLGAEADRVFTPFFTTKANGIGMGLSISRSLIEDHGGRLWATPNSPHGTKFCFTLPVAAENPS